MLFISNIHIRLNCQRASVLKEISNNFILIQRQWWDTSFAANGTLSIYNLSPTTLCSAVGQVFEMAVKGFNKQTNK